MHVTVKVLNGQECSLAVSPSSQVNEVKELINTLMSISPDDQKLLFRGKALSDDKQLKDYNIDDGSKLVLVIKKPSKDSTDPAVSPVSQSQPPSTPVCEEHLPPVWEKLQSFLRRHFREKDADLVLAEFRKSFETSLTHLSLDDIDRYAASKMRQMQL